MNIEDLQGIFEAVAGTAPGWNTSPALFLTEEEARTGCKKAWTHQLSLPCGTCGGSGKRGLFKCKSCRGNGKALHEIALVATVPPGTVTGDTLAYTLQRPEQASLIPAGYTISAQILSAAEQRQVDTFGTGGMPIPK